MVFGHPSVNKKLTKKVRALQVFCLISNQLPHLCDQLNTTRSRRREMFKICQKTSITTKSTALTMKVLLGAIVLSSAAQPAAAFKLPKQVTPAVRAACETDVRRLCVRRGSTMSTVKTCVRRKFMRLNFNCKMRILQAGLR